MLSCECNMLFMRHRTHFLNHKHTRPDMGKLIAGLLLGCLIAGLAFFFGYSFKETVVATKFEFSSKLESETKLGVSYSDLSTIVEVCPNHDWLVFQGKGRILLYASNRYHYSLNWDPKKDILPQKSPKQDDLWDLKVTVKDIEITMDPDPKIDAYIIDRSVFVDEYEEIYLLKEGLFKRLEIMAGNKLHTKNGRASLTRAIKSHIYQIYSSEKTRIGNIAVTYSDTAFPAFVEYNDYKFDNECTKKLLSIGDTEKEKPGLLLPETIRIFQW